MRDGNIRHPGRRPPRWLVRGASLPGYDHVRAGSWCEDSFAHASIPREGLSDIQILAVADGAGSRPRSAEGSRLAVSLALAVTKDYIRENGFPPSAPEWREDLELISEKVVSQFLDVAGALAGRGTVDDLATTLTMVVIAAPVVGIISIGDGFVVIRTGAGGATNIHLVDSAEASAQYASHTVFLTSDLRDAIRINAIYDPEITGVFVSTDGLIPATLVRGEDGGLRLAEQPVIDTVLHLLDQDDFDPYHLVRLLQRDNVIAATQDDTTLLVAVLRP